MTPIPTPRILAGIQPWWWIVLYLDKCVENRTRPVLGDYRGELLLHASKSKGRTVDQQHWAAARDFVEARFGEALAARIPPIEELPMGGIVGRATVTGLVRPWAGTYPAGVDGRWHVREQFGYLLTGARTTPFVPWRGCQSTVEAPAVLLTDILAFESKPYAGLCSVCGRDTLLVHGRCSNQSICRTGRDGPDHYP
jgi:hypothetical protein